MPTTTAQIVSFVRNEEATFKEVNDFKGLKTRAIGIGIEEPEARQLVLEWDTENSSESVEPQFQTAARNVHVEFNESLATILASPVTEIAFATTKPGQDLITYGEIINVALRAAAQQPSCKGTSWGYAKENPGIAVLVVGWDTVDAHKKFARSEVFKVTTLPLDQGVTTLEMAHYKFQ